MSQLKEHYKNQQNSFSHDKAVKSPRALNHRLEPESGPQLGAEGQIPLSPQEQNLIQAVSCAAKDYKQSESILVLRFCELAKTQAFKKCGYPNLFTFALKHLGLTEGTAYLLVKVAKKAQEIPQLVKEITSSELSLRAIGRLAPVVTKENAATLFARAKTVTSRELEHLVATLNPRAVRREHRSALNSEDTRVSVTLNQAELAAILRCQELLMQKSLGAVSLAETVATLAEDYLKRHSPEQKAARAEARLRKNSSHEAKSVDGTKEPPARKACQPALTKADAQEPPQRNSCQEEPTATHSEDQSRRKSSHIITTAAAFSTKDQSQQRPGQISTKAASHQKSRTDYREKPFASPANGPDQLSQHAPTFTIQEITPNPKSPRFIPAKIVHFVSQRDQHCCTHMSSSGDRCGEKKFLHLHHIKPLSEGGNHHPDNLTQLCAYHHDLVHQLSFADWANR